MSLFVLKIEIHICKLHFSLYLKFVNGMINGISINPLNAELNPICYLLALLGAHHFLHVSRIRVKSLTLKLLISSQQASGLWPLAC